MKNTRLSISIKAWASQRAANFVCYCAGIGLLMSAAGFAFYLFGGNFGA